MVTINEAIVHQTQNIYLNSSREKFSRNLILNASLIKIIKKGHWFVDQQYRRAVNNNCYQL